MYPNLVPAGLTPCPLAQAFDGALGASKSIGYGRVHCDLGVLRTRTNTGFSDYNGLQLELRGHQLWHQFTTKAGYTFSKTTDNASEIFSTGAAGGTSAFSQSQVNFTGNEHGLSGLDFRHNFFLSVSEDLPMYRNQQGVLGHILGGWTISATYALASGQPYTAVQGGLNCGSGGGSCSNAAAGNPYDGRFNNAFVGADGALRPFLGSNSAPVSAVGIFAGDQCAVDINGNLCGNAAITATTLISLNAANNGLIGTMADPIANNPLNPNGLPVPDPNHPATVVTSKDVRFIANTATADTFFGTPFGNVARNTLRDAKTNIANFSLFKTVHVRENFKVVWHMTMLNAFNHPNFFSVDPLIDDAGFATEGNGFGMPSLTTGGLQGGVVGTPGRSIRFGITLRW